MGRAPIIKNGIRIFIMINAKGASPIAKNVIVVDENGNQYEATYPKRARNLVKNGRARYIDDNKICLACPPSIELEEDEMSKKKKKKKQVIEMITSLKDILNSYSANVISAINYVDESQQCMEDGTTLEYNAEVALEKVKAIKEIQATRENTYNKLLDFYLRLYDELDKEETDA